MTEGSILLFPAGPDLVGQVIKSLTGGPAHVAICVGGFIFDDTIWKQPGRWLPVSGARITPLAALASLGVFAVRDPVVTWNAAEIASAVAAAVAQVNLRRRYNVALLVFDAILYPLRVWFKVKWDPFKKSKEYVCSSFVGMVYRATGRDPWPGVDTEELAPEDFVAAKEWKDG